jgi:hypothetical protein
MSMMLRTGTACHVQVAHHRFPHLLHAFDRRPQQRQARRLRLPQRLRLPALAGDSGGGRLAGGRGKLHGRLVADAERAAGPGGVQAAGLSRKGDNGGFLREIKIRQVTKTAYARQTVDNMAVRAADSDIFEKSSYRTLLSPVFDVLTPRCAMNLAKQVGSRRAVQSPAPRR